MSFAYPEFLYALAFLGIPIIIHLFNFRKYKVVRFSQVKFLKEVKQHTKSTSRLKHLLVLLSRCLLFTFLVLAFAKPILIKDNKSINQGKKGVSIYIDNSFSMASNAEDGLLLDLAKNKAIKILDAYKETDKFQLITNEFKASDQRWFNKQSFIDELQKVKLSPIFRPINQVLSRQTQKNNGDELSPIYFLISDLQQNSFTLKKPSEDSLSINIIPIQTDNRRNVSLDSLYLENPFHLAGNQENITYRIRNYIAEKIENIPVKLYVNDILKSPSKVSVFESSEAKGDVNFKSSSKKIQQGELVLKDYPITFDDTLFFNYSIHNQVQVLHIHGDAINSGIKNLFENDTFFIYQSNSKNKINYDNLASNNFIILDELISIGSGLSQELGKFVNNGGSIFLIPNQNLDKENINNFLGQFETDSYSNYSETKVSLANINLSSSIFDGVFNEIPVHINLPEVSGFWRLNNQINSIKENVIGLQNGLAFLSKYKINNGSIFLAGSSINKDNSNFTKHAIFVPTLYRMALLSLKTKPLLNFIGDQNITISIPNSSESPIRLINNQIDFIPKQRRNNQSINFDIGNDLTQAGHYQIVLKEDTLGILSLNYNRKESDLLAFSVDEIKEIALENQINLTVFEADTKSLSYEINHQSDGVPLWKYFLILALLFILIEILLLRFLK